MKKYVFRNLSDLLAGIKVFIGNQEKDFLVYSDENDYAVLLLIRWNESRQFLQFINRWKIQIEIDGNEVYIACDASKKILENRMYLHENFVNLFSIF